MKKQFLMLLAVACTTLFVGCSNKLDTTYPENPGEPTEVALKSIAIDKHEVTLGLKGTETLSVTFTPSNATNTEITWSSDNETVVRVDDKGVLTAVTEGTANITATSNENADITDVCKVTVINDEAYAIEISVDESKPLTTSATIEYTPNHYDRLYAFGVVAYTDQIKDVADKDLIADYFGFLAQDPMALMMFSGMESVEFEFYGFEPNTEYMAMAFAYEANDDGTYTLSNELFKHNFTTNPVPEDIIGAFNATATTSVGGINVTIDKGSYTGNYYVGNIDMDTWSSLGGDVKALADGFIEQESYIGTNMTEADNIIIFNENITDHKLEGWYVAPDGAYNVVCIFALAANGLQDREVEPTLLFVQTKEAETDPSVTIELEVLEVDYTTAKVKVTPSNDNVLIYRSVWASHEIEGVSNEDLLNNIAYQEEFMLGIAVGEETLEYTGLDPYTGYTMLAAGIDPDALWPNTELFRLDFATTNAPSGVYNAEQFQNTEDIRIPLAGKRHFSDEVVSNIKNKITIENGYRTPVTLR